MALVKQAGTQSLAFRLSTVRFHLRPDPRAYARFGVIAQAGLDAKPHGISHRRRTSTLHSMPLGTKGY